MLTFKGGGTNYTMKELHLGGALIQHVKYEIFDDFLLELQF